MKRQSYTLGCCQGQTKQACRVRRGGAAELAGILPASGRHSGERVGNPRRLVPFAPERNRGEIGRVGLHQQLPARHETEQVLVSPFPERHDSAEGHAPAGIDRELGQGVRAGVAVQDTGHAGDPRLTYQRARIVFRVAGVNDHWPLHFAGQRDLSGKGRQLGRPRRIVVVVIETALPHRNRRILEKRA